MHRAPIKCAFFLIHNLQPQVDIFLTFRRVGSDAFNAVSQSMVCRYIEKYTNLILNHLTPIYVRFPQGEQEIAETKGRFMQKYNIPGTLGIIDGTHVTIKALPRNIEAPYVNRKHFHSINAQIVCNADMLITNVNARYPGSAHDSHVFSNSRIYTLMETINNAHPIDWNWLIGIELHSLQRK